MKKNITLFFCILIGIFFLSASSPMEKSAVTTGSLFQEMTDMAALTYFPSPAYKTIQYSSYDRRSHLPEGPDWFSNSDGFGGEPIPNFQKVLKEPGEDGIGEYLMAEVSGPGAVVRLWTAAISGEIMVFLDEADKPVWSGPAQSFFHSTFDVYDEFSRIDQELFKRTVYQRDASYTPIPFANHLKIIWKGKLDTIHFYQIQVRHYEPEAVVKTFRPEDILSYQKIINRVCARLARPDDVEPDSTDEPEATFASEIGPGKKAEILKIEEGGALKKFSLHLEAENQELALRQTVLHIICDDYRWGQVQSPVGDFFGAAPGINPYDSLPFSVLSDGTMICRYVIPFQNSLRLVLENLGAQSVYANGSALPMRYIWDKERSMHFRARWRASHNIIASNKDVQDLPFLMAWGKGVYVGTAAYILNPNDVPTPYGSWWGEGDEKVFVDEEIFPSTFGTGSEDYFNYSWSSPDIFFFPYCGQPRNDGPGNRGFVTNFRWQILDRIPFQESIRFYMELYSHERTPGLSYARMAYHYALPGIHDDHQALMPEDVRELTLPEIWHPANRMGARNSVFFNAEDCLESAEHTALKKGRIWAGGQLCVWMPQKPGDRKDYRFEVAEGGKKRIHMAAGLYPESGKIRVFLDGKALNEDAENTIDLHRPFRTLLRSFRLAEMEISSGTHTLALEFIGAPGSVKIPEIGIDFIWVQTVQ